MRYLLALLLLPSLLWAQETGYNVEPESGYFASGCSLYVRTFNGSSQYFSNANGSHAALEPGATVDVSVVSWYKPSALDATRYIYYQGGDATGRPGVAIRALNGGGVQCVMSTSSGTFAASFGASSMVVGTQYMIALTADRSGNLECYLNTTSTGAPADISAVVGDALTNSVALTVGSLFNGTSLASGDISVTSVLVGSVLSGANVTSIYNGGTPTTCAVMETTYSATECWKMQSGAGEDEAGQIASITLTQVNGVGQGCFY